MRVSHAAFAAALVCAVLPLPEAHALDDVGYFAVADRLVTRLDARWDAGAQRYDPGPGAATAEVNGDLLLVHAVAALHGHHGPARADHRARAVARFLVGPEIWTDTPPVGANPKATGPGWRAAPGSPLRHMVFDTEVVDGLVHAYLARDVLGLEADVVERIRTQIHTVATSDDWRWPALRLNQFNWYCAMYAADALVNGARSALATGMAAHLQRFLAGPSLGGGLRFHYLPDQPPEHRMNVDSAEYANIVLSFSRFYGAARAAGMPVPAGLARLRGWVRRAVAGYWTHGGYLNWDTGLGFRRWHQTKKVPLAAQALIGIASAPELQTTPEWGAWAKWLLDQGLQSYVAHADRAAAVPAPLGFGVHVFAQLPSDAYLAAARHAANALRALEAGLGSAPASSPPALYAYDPDSGRMAVTTPAYNTAIVAVNQGAFPYGGLDLARLYDGDQEVAANIGGMGAAAFGLVVRDRGRVLVRTQYGRREYAPGAAPLRVTADGARLPLTGRRAFAGPFRALRATGTVRRNGVSARVDYRFAPGSIAARWSLRSGRGLDARVTFPSWGRGASVSADGARLGSGWVRVRVLRIVSERSGYTVQLARPAAARLVAVAPQASAPNPGPTVEVAVAGAALAARLTIL